MFQPPKYAQNLYDAVMILAITINDTISKGQNYSSGVAILKNLENKSFSSKIMRCTTETSSKNLKQRLGWLPFL